MRAGLFVFFSYLKQSWQVCSRCAAILGCRFLNPCCKDEDSQDIHVLTTPQDQAAMQGTLALLNEGLTLLSKLPPASLFQKYTLSVSWKTTLRKCVEYVLRCMLVCVLTVLARFLIATIDDARVQSLEVKASVRAEYRAERVRERTELQGAGRGRYSHEREIAA